jgi:hypothetical protein
MVEGSETFAPFLYSDTHPKIVSLWEVPAQRWKERSMPYTDVPAWCDREPQPQIGSGRELATKANYPHSHLFEDCPG